MSIYKESGITDFDCDHTFDCGQCFRWDREEDGSYTGVVAGECANVSFQEGVLTVETGGNLGAADATGGAGPGGEGSMNPQEWREYLHLDRDYGLIKAELAAGDKVMETAISKGQGIRLLVQDPWESLISFIISQNSNIPRIKKCIESLCQSYGQPLGNYRGKQRFSFPEAQRLASLSREDLAGCRLGYRDTYIIETARAVAEDGGARLMEARKLPPAEAEAYLRSLKGVGPKVANCIMLFGLQQYSSFPLDVWMKRIMNRLYGFAENDVKGMSAYAAEHFGELSGFAQQYLFYYAREQMEK